MILLPVTASAASNGIGITPRNNFTANPGDTVKGSIVVKNLDSKNNLNASIQLLDFKPAGQTGEPSLILKDETPTKWSLKPYMTIQDSVTIKPAESSNVPFTITIPKNMGGGSLYGAIRVSSAGNTDSGNVGLSSSAVSLVFVNVSGKTNSSLTLEKFGAFVPTSNLSDGAYKTVFGATKPKYISYSLKNNGNVVEEPIGSIQITGPLGKQYKVIQNINPNHSLVLIGQTRRIDICLQEPAGSNLSNTDQSVEDLTKCQTPSLMPGRYKAKIDLLYGDHNNSSTEIQAVSSFWYLPVWFIIALAAAVLIIIGVIWLVVHLIRSRKDRVYRRR